MESLLDSLVVAIRADTQGLDRDLDELKGNLAGLETTQAAARGGFASLQSEVVDVTGILSQATTRATQEMSRSFERFARTGELSFANLRSTALSAIDAIASSAINSGIEQIFGSVLGMGQQGGGGFFGGVFNSIGTALGFAGRAAGGPVSEDRPFLVGERGPEIFVPQSAGRVLPHTALNDRATRRPINITVNVGNNVEAPAMRQSAGQVALAVRRALMRAERDL